MIYSKRKAIFVWPLLALLLCAPAFGAAEDEKADTPFDDLSPELQKVLKQLERANSDVKSLVADVNYKRQIPLLDESETSTGKLEFLKPDKIHLKLGKPRNEEIYSDGKNWWVTDHDEKQTEIYDAASKNAESPEASFLTFGYGESPRNLLETYVISLKNTKQRDKSTKKENNLKIYTLRFEPRDKDASTRFAAIETEIPGDSWLPRNIVLHESDGEIVHQFRLHNRRTNVKLKDKTFSYKPPKGYTILRP
ncbi:MAG: LolA family protein [Candidatus Brocadiia bacterium]